MATLDILLPAIFVGMCAPLEQHVSSNEQMCYDWGADVLRLGYWEIVSL